MPRNGLQLAKRSLQFVRPYRRALSGVITLALILAALSAIDPLVMKYLFDELERRTGLQTLMVIMAGLVVLELTRAAQADNLADINKKLSAWAAIFAVSTLIAGVYGMNFRVLPGAEWQYGFPLVLLVMAVAGVALYRLFRRSGWL